MANINEHGADPDSPQLEKIHVSTGTYWLVTMTGIICYAVLTTIGILTWSSTVIVIPVPFFKEGLQLHPSLLFFFLVAAHVIRSFFAEDELHTDEHGVLYFFGSPVRVFKSAGLKFVLWGLFEFDRLPKDLQEIHAPDKKEKIFWGDDKDDLPKGMTRALRFTTRTPEDVDKNPLDAQLTIGIGYFVLWTISDPVQFRAHVRTVPEADSQLRLMSGTALGEVISTFTPSTAISGQKVINNTLDDVIREKTKGWGVQINSTGLSDINLSHKLSSVMRDRAANAFENEIKVASATADATAMKLLGAAEGKANEDREAGTLIGRATGMKRIMTDLNVSGEAVLATETTRELLDKADVIIPGVGNAVGDLIGAATAAAESLKAKKGDK